MHAGAVTGRTACSRHAVPSQWQRNQAGIRPRPSSERRAAAAAAGSAAPTTADALLAWGQKQNLVATDKVTTALSITSSEPLLVAARDLGAGEALVTVPESQWLTPEVVRRSRLGQLAEGLEPWLQLALYLLAEKGSPSGSASLFVDNAAPALGTPLFWSDEELEQLQGTQLLASTLAYRQFFQQRYQQLEQELFVPNRSVFPESVFTQHNFTWAVATVRSRTHPPLDGDRIALVPLADSVPHRRRANVQWKLKTGLFGAKPSLAVETSSSIRKGEELSMDYGPDKLDNAVLLDYGVLDTSRTQAGYTLTLTLPDTDRYFDDKLDILERNGLGQSASFTLAAGMAPGEEMMGFLRLMQLSGSDCFLLESIFERDVWMHMCFPVSDQNEAAVCTAMIAGAQEALTGYPTTIDEDLVQLRSGACPPGSRQEAAVRVRLGEKEALDSVLGWFEERQKQLDELEYYQERRLKRLGLIDDQGRTTYDSFFQDGIA